LLCRPYDAYNYQPFNLIMTPQERGSIFANYDYQSTMRSSCIRILYSRTSSGFMIAPCRSTRWQTTS
jgi:hypothetical protein